MQHKFKYDRQVVEKLYYDKKKELLTVFLSDESNIEYRKVPLEKYEEFEESESPDEYLLKEIQGSFKPN